MADPKHPNHSDSGDVSRDRRVHDDDLDAEQVVEDAIEYFGGDETGEAAASSPASDADAPAPG